MSSTLNKILDDADIFKRQVAKLKALAPLYPQTFKDITMNRTTWFTTMVEFEYNGVRFKRHHVESGILSNSYTEDQLLARLNQAAELCKKFAIPCKFDDVISVVNHNQ